MTVRIAQRDGDAQSNAHTHHDVEEDTEAFVLESNGALTTSRDKTQDRHMIITTDDAFVLFILASCTFRKYGKDVSKHIYRKICESVLTALHKQRVPTI